MAKRAGGTWCFFSSGVIVSPIPSTHALCPRKKNGTSAPKDRPILSSAARGRFSPQSRLSARRVVAASDEPPPIPACDGMLLRTPMRAPWLQPVACWRARAARKVRSTSGKAIPRSSRVMVAFLLRSKCSVSHQSTSMKTDCSKWYPSARWPVICRKRLSFAGAGTSYSECMATGDTKKEEVSASVRGARWLVVRAHRGGPPAVPAPGWRGRRASRAWLNERP